MSTTAIVITAVFSSAFVMNVALMVNSRIRRHLGFTRGLGKDVYTVILATVFFPVVIAIGIREIYYRNRPRPVPRKLRKWLKDDTVFSEGKSMSLAEYNDTHERQFTLEQVYGKRYVRNLYKAGKPDFHHDAGPESHHDLDAEF